MTRVTVHEYAARQGSLLIELVHPLKAADLPPERETEPTRASTMTAS